jgi:hypothetical protein
MDNRTRTLKILEAFGVDAAVDAVLPLIAALQNGGELALVNFGNMLDIHGGEKYAFIELFGHNCLGPCIVREVHEYGAAFCEATPIKQDGTLGWPQKFPGSAIYRNQPIDKETAFSVAKRNLMFLPSRSESAGEPVDAEWEDQDEPDEEPSSIDLFLDKCCRQNADSEISAETLYEAYKSFCADTVFQPEAMEVFEDAVLNYAATAHGRASAHGSEIYIGVTLHPDYLWLIDKTPEVADHAVPAEIPAAPPTE